MMFGTRVCAPSCPFAAVRDEAWPLHSSTLSQAGSLRRELQPLQRRRPRSRRRSPLHPCRLRLSVAAFTQSRSAANTRPLFSCPSTSRNLVRPFWVLRASERIRTSSHRVRTALLCPLSYRGRCDASPARVELAQRGFGNLVPDPLARTVWEPVFRLAPTAFGDAPYRVSHDEGEETNAPCPCEVSNLGPPACRAGALPLSYTDVRGEASQDLYSSPFVPLARIEHASPVP